MENVIYYFLGFVGVSLGVWVGMFYFGEANSARYEQDLIDSLRSPRSPWDILYRCGYCNSKLSQMTDRCTHCGAPK
jgi:hypothetical protein